MSRAYGIVFSVFFLFLSASKLSSAESDGCVTAACHPQIKVGKMLHGPIKGKGCHVCHLKGDGPGKLPKDHPFLKPIVKSEITNSCVVCHDDEVFVNEKFVHKVIGEKTCLACHDPHKSDLRSLFKKEAPPALCLSCHEKQKRDYKYKHSALTTKKTCLNCHEAHASANRQLLITNERDACMQCHEKDAESPDHRLIPGLGPIFRTKNFKHKPVKEGKCSECHSPHGGDERGFLIRPYSEQFHLPYNEDAYELCFHCHKTEMISMRSVSTQTNFRNGNINLHFVHVAATRGRSCRTCHEIHAGSNPKLIKDFVVYLGVETPMVYEGTPNGGSCAAACHGKKSYDRLKEVTNATER
jgi:predicted CXXCH cytochrome family protein